MFQKFVLTMLFMVLPIIATAGDGPVQKQGTPDKPNHNRPRLLLAKLFGAKQQPSQEVGIVSIGQGNSSRIDTDGWFQPAEDLREVDHAIYYPDLPPAPLWDGGGDTETESTEEVTGAVYHTHAYSAGMDGYSDSLPEARRETAKPPARFCGTCSCHESSESNEPQPCRFEGSCFRPA